MRGGVVAAAIAVAVSAAGAGQLAEADAQVPCQPVTRTLSNGGAGADGALTVVVDGSGAFSDATFNPPGPTGAAATTDDSRLFVGGPVGRFLTGECVFVDAEAPGQALTTRFDAAPLSIVLTQTLGAPSSRTSALTQTYRIANTSGEAVSLALVRHLDGDLMYDATPLDGASASADGAQLSQFDAGDGPPAETLLAITGSLATAVPDRWTIKPAPYAQAIDGANEIPAGDHGTGTATPADVTLSQQWNASIPAGGEIAFTTTTHFGTPPTQHALSVSKTGDGTVTSSPAGIDCGPACTAPFDEGTRVQLHATPNPGWSFAGWEGACSGTGACTVALDAPRSVIARFSPPPPAPGQNANAVPVQGVVLIREPGTGRFVPLTAADQIPVGTQVDASNGRIELTAARAGGFLETSQFYEGLFTLLQESPAALPEIRLDGGDFSCIDGSFSFLARSRKPIRRIWGSGKGRYRTRGKYSAATVRGTRWKTEDRCDGTLTLVEEGVVSVRDFARRAEVTLRGGQSYLAEPLGRGLSGVGCTLIGTSGNDVLRGTPKRDVLCGVGGNDVLFGMGGNDRLYGGDGNDWLDGGPGNDLLVGGRGRDRLDGHVGRDHLLGGSGRDLMLSRDGFRGNDRVAGGPGVDRCRTDYVRICP